MKKSAIDKVSGSNVWGYVGIGASVVLVALVTGAVYASRKADMAEHKLSDAVNMRDDAQDAADVASEEVSSGCCGGSGIDGSYGEGTGEMGGLNPQGGGSGGFFRNLTRYRGRKAAVRKPMSTDCCSTYCSEQYKKGIIDSAQLAICVRQRCKLDD